MKNLFANFVTWRMSNVVHKVQLGCLETLFTRLGGNRVGKYNCYLQQCNPHVIACGMI